MSEAAVIDKPAETGTTTAAATTATTTEKPDAGSIIGGPGEGKPTDTPSAPIVGAPKAPESYADFKLGEGISKDEVALGDFTKLAKELDLSQEQAQKVIDLQGALLTRQLQAHKQMTEGWAAESNSDAEIGGAKMAKTRADCQKAVAWFNGSDPTNGKIMIEDLNLTGFANKPAWVRFFSRVGRLVGEGTISDGKTGKVGAAESAADRLFPNTPKQ